MSTNRPALSNFFAAFRAHTASLSTTTPSVITTPSAVIASAQAAWSQAKHSSTASSQQHQYQQQQQPQPQQPQPQSQQQQPQATTASAPRPIDTRKTTYSTSSVQPTQSNPTQMYNAYPPLQHNMSPLTHGTRGPPSPSNATSTQRGRPQYPTCQEARRQQRRGSDSSSDGGMGFRDTARGGERWYIGGRTAGGEERFYRLSMATRDKSADRLSADRMSL